MEASSLRLINRTDPSASLNTHIPAPLWVPDNYMDHCVVCEKPFTFTHRRHHCRGCGQLYCSKCTSYRHPLTELGYGRTTSKSQRVCKYCYERFTFINQIEVFPAFIRIKIADYLPPESICQLESVNHEWYRVLTSEEADRLLWLKFIQMDDSTLSSQTHLSPKTSNDSQEKSLYGRPCMNLYLRQCVMHQNGISRLISFIRWPDKIVREESAKMLLQSVVEQKNQDKLCEINGIQILVQLLISLTESVLSSTSSLIPPSHLKLAELITGILMNGVQKVEANQIAVRTAGGITTLLRYITSSPASDSRYNKLRLYCTGTLCNITNFVNENCIEIGQVGGISVITSLLYTSNNNNSEKLSNYAAALLGNLLRKTPENQDHFRQCGGISILVKQLSITDIKHINYIIALRNSLFMNMSNQRELRKVGGIPILLKLVQNNDNKVSEAAVTSLLYCTHEETSCRDEVYHNGGIDIIISNMLNGSDVFCENAWGVLMNITNGGGRILSPVSTPVPKDKTSDTNMLIEILIKKIKSYCMVSPSEKTLEYMFTFVHNILSDSISYL